MNLGRWEDEGGAVESSSRIEIGSDIGLHSAEEILRIRGAAVITQWNELPTEVQRILFEDAASTATAARRFALKQQIAQFLHDHKDDG